MQVGIAKIVKTRHEIEDAKEWCKASIKLRLDKDKLFGDLDKINYKVFPYVHSASHNSSIGYKIEARLDL